MLQFVDLKQETPVKRSTTNRKSDFNEIYNEFITDKATEQSSRCSQCGVPFCQIHCPLHNNIPDWLKLTAEGRLKEANELVHSTNNMPEVCGRICPQDRLCEGNCVIEQSGHGTVTIGSVEKHITEMAWEKNWIQPIKVKEENEYTLKADALAKVADQETNFYKRKELFEEARAYELAGDKQRTKRLLKELKDDQVDFEKTSEIVVVSREQSHKNEVANQAWKYETQSDSLFNKAKVLREKAEKNENAVDLLAVTYGLSLKNILHRSSNVSLMKIYSTL